MLDNANHPSSQSSTHSEEADATETQQQPLLRSSNHHDGVIVPRDNDILCGRGKSFLAHLGNKKFIEMVRSNLERYKHAPKRIDKSLLVMDLVATLKEQGIRFIKLRPDGKTYFELDDAQAREKTGHAIRDLLKPLKPKSPKMASKKWNRLASKKKECLSQSNHVNGTSSSDLVPTSVHCDVEAITYGNKKTPLLPAVERFSPNIQLCGSSEGLPLEENILESAIMKKT